VPQGFYICECFELISKSRSQNKILILLVVRLRWFAKDLLRPLIGLTGASARRLEKVFSTRHAEIHSLDLL